MFALMLKKTEDLVQATVCFDASEDIPFFVSEVNVSSGKLIAEKLPDQNAFLTGF